MNECVDTGLASIFRTLRHHYCREEAAKAIAICERVLSYLVPGRCYPFRDLDKATETTKTTVNEQREHPTVRTYG